ncbi:diguanylate cyclase [Halobacillus alkaliphilus]|uniref:Diguanylate cyclase n=1 Tax=Halobacillus alkaliphilus TaxID=396056 RepID=A0A1I2Q1E8_9BACI|nr:diguanylate cyclase [Halobacillus alkaliphilus]SFG22192.1 diguanylate cyclase [Halobacillus alkaliphilus]
MIVSEFFVNICILIALLFSYLQVRWNKLDIFLSKKTVLIIDGIAGGILGNIVMYYSIQVTAQTFVDLRHIPVLVLLLFIGLKPAVISSLLVIAGRFVYGFNYSSLGAFILMVILLAGFCFIRRKWGNEEQIFKTAIYMLAFSNVVFSIIIAILVQDWETLQILLPTYWILSFLGGSLAVYLVDYLRTSHYLFKTYEEQSSIDFLTGLNNVRQFDALWNRTLNGAVENKESLSLLMVDVDHFKHVNDTYGHPAGDMVLQQLGQILKDKTRSFDIVSRNGGEEFSIILPDCPNARAFEIAERIRLAVKDHPFPISNKETIYITVSIGVSTYPEKAAKAEQIIKLADQSLYKAKQAGRNRTVSLTSELI